MKETSYLIAMNDSQSAISQNIHETLTIVATAKDEAALLEDLLRQIFHHTDGIPRERESQDSPAPEGEIVGFRATGKEITELLAETVGAALDEAEVQQVTITGVDLAGMMATDSGIRSWGYLATKERTAPRPRAVLVGSATVSTSNDHFRAEVLLEIDRS